MGFRVFIVNHMPRQPRYLASSLLLAATSLLLLLLPSPVRATSIHEIDESIARGKAWLYAQQANGTWETDAAPRPGRQHTRWGGHTAIVVYALLAAGEKPNAPELKRAIEFLEKADDVEGTYALGLRAQVWWLLGNSKATAEPIRRDTALLLAGCYESGSHAGMYTYGLSGPGGGAESRAKGELRLRPAQSLDARPSPSPSVTLRGTGRVPSPAGKYDHSNSQYGVLGTWAVAEVGGEVPASYWRTVDAAWKKAQDDDGGWDYIDGRRSTASMTAAGIATLYITQDFLLNGSTWSNCAPRPPDPHIARGLAWMDRHIRQALDGKNTYTMYGIERIGLASGRKYFGKVAWFADGSDLLVHGQNADGSWTGKFAGADEVASTAYALLFLCRGRAPVMMNKLEYGVGDETVAAGAARPAAAKVEEGEEWNERPRDLAHLTKWVGRASEGFYNWQTVSLNASPDDLHDAPILYIAGRDALQFGDADIAKLRQFVEQGGLILGNADCGRELFAKSFRELGAALFPKYEFRELPRDHVIYTGQQYPATHWKVHPHLLSLGNGVRELMVLIPDFDPSRLWQTDVVKGHEEPFQLGADLFLYMTGGKDPRVRVPTWIVHAQPAVKPTRTVKLARIQLGDNWDPEPAGWRRLAAILHNERHTDLDVQPVKLGDGSLSGYRLAHWTGTTRVTLSDAQRRELHDFVAGGGTLIVDAAGGAGLFAESIEVELGTIFGTAGLEHPLSPDHAVYRIPESKIESLSFRAFSRKSTIGANKTARVRGIAADGDRIGVFYSPDDLSAGLVGQQVDGISGYEPATATQLMTNFILYASGSAAPATQPTTQPVTPGS